MESPTGHSYAQDKEMLLQRLSRIEGQARGIARMVADDRYCVDILQQIASMQSAADAVALILLENHVKGCVAEGLRSGSEERVDEVVGVIRRYLKR
jgi:CsoR family transcriptional regulator, copper-sensing transcriptional repressor